MKSNLNLLQTRIFCVVALGIESLFGLAAATENSAGSPPATAAIPWSQLGAKADVNPTFSDANWSSMGGIPGVDGEVYAVVVDDSGNLYIGGSFNIAGEVIVNNIAKWDGSTWSALGSGISSGIDEGYTQVSALAVSGSDLYVGGRFTTAGGNPASNVAKWNGSSWSVLGSGISGGIDEGYTQVSAMAVSGSDLYVGGRFGTAGGNPASNVAKWNGSSWSALGSGLDGWFSEVPPGVSALAVLGNDVYAAGAFTTAGGSPASNIAKWDGSSWSALGSGLNGGDYPHVSALVVSGSDLYAGGKFLTAGRSPANYVAKWNGSSWSALGSGLGGDPPYYVRALTTSGSHLYAGGSFATAGGSAANNIAKWDGSTWTALGSGLTSGGGDNSSVSALAVSGSDLYAGGFFTSAAPSIAKWNGSTWTALGSGMNGWVGALAVLSSDLYAGGSFTTAGGSPASNMAKWDGSSWTTLGSGMNGGVYALAGSGGDLYAGGWFTRAGGSAATNVAKWNGSSWSALGSGLNDGVFALAVSGSDLYAGGAFTTAGGSAARGIAKWDGSSWSALGSGLRGVIDPGGYTRVSALALAGSDLYAGGDFTTAGGSAARGIAKWDGSSWSALGSGMSAEIGASPSVTALAVSGSDLYAGGGFTRAGGHAARRIAKWDGSTWTALGSGMDNGVWELAVSGSDLYAGGGFTTAGGHAANYIAKWDGSTWTTLGSGMGGVIHPGGYTSVEALALSGSDLYVGGGFTTAGGKVSGYTGRAYLPALPTLSVLHSGASVMVSWPTTDTAGFALEQTGPLAALAGWVTNSAAVTNDGAHKSVTLPATKSSQFFRLRRP